MSTSLVYHAFGARTYKHFRTDFRGGAVYFHLTKKPHKRRCVVCGSKYVTKEGRRQVTVRTIPIGLRPVYLVLHLHLLRCRQCGSVRQESRDVAEPRKSYTKSLKRLVLKLSRWMSISDIQRYLKLGWDLIKAIIKEDLQRRAKKRSLRKVKRIAIDEISIRRGRRYLTVVLDLDTGDVLFTALGNDHKALKPFFDKLKRARAKLRAIAVDMAGGYAKAIKLYAPKDVTVVFDKFHVVALMNRVVDEVRRAEQRRLEDDERKVLKGARFLLLYGIETLMARDIDQPLVVPRLERLDALLEANQTLYEVYILKEELRWLWSHPTKQAAAQALDRWIADAQQVDQPELSRFADTLDKHREGILAYYDEPITTGPLEGLNAKLKLLKRIAYGYRDTDFFQLRILFIHDLETKVVGA